MKLVREYMDFEKGKDPKRAMGIGKFYEIWRENHTRKPIAKITFFLTDPMENKKRYIVYLNYENNWEGSADSIWWGRGKFIGSWRGEGTSFFVGNMQNKPANFFEGDPEERVMWQDPENFNKDIIDLFEKGRVKEAITEVLQEWWEVDFEAAMRDWFRSGVMTIHRIEYKAL